MNTWLRVIAVAAGLVLSACSTVPNDIGGTVDSTLTIARVRAEPSLAQGQLVRWGGLVARVQNRENQTWIEIVEKPLGSYGQPVDANITNGRFIAIFDRFLDPMIFQIGREITVMGSVQPPVDGKIDEQPYSYVVVSASGYHLWQPRQDRHHDDMILLHRSYWDPWWYRPVYIHHHHHPRPSTPNVVPPQPNSTFPVTGPRPARPTPENPNLPRTPRTTNSDDNDRTPINPRRTSSDGNERPAPKVYRDREEKKKR